MNPTRISGLMMVVLAAAWLTGCGSGIIEQPERKKLPKAVPGIGNLYGTESEGCVNDGNPCDYCWDGICEDAWIGGDDGCDCGCAEHDPDCGPAPEPEPECVADGDPCDYCWQDDCQDAWIGAGDGCDCGCQVHDPDCGEEPDPEPDPDEPDPQPECVADGNPCNYCHGGECQDNWIGTNDGCDCGCEVHDPDCGEEQEPEPEPEPDPECVADGNPCNYCWEENCQDNWIGTNDGCDCGCGVHDPDCGEEPEPEPEPEVCVADGNPCNYCWNQACSDSWIGANDGCDCGCEVHDPDCGPPPDDGGQDQITDTGLCTAECNGQCTASCQAPAGLFILDSRRAACPIAQGDCSTPLDGYFNGLFSQLSYSLTDLGNYLGERGPDPTSSDVLYRLEEILNTFRQIKAQEQQARNQYGQGCMEESVYSQGIDHFEQVLTAHEQLYLFAKKIAACRGETSSFDLGSYQPVSKLTTSQIRMSCCRMHEGCQPEGQIYGDPKAYDGICLVDGLGTNHFQSLDSLYFKSYSQWEVLSEMFKQVHPDGTTSVKFRYCSDRANDKYWSREVWFSPRSGKAEVIEVQPRPSTGYVRRFPNLCGRFERKQWLFNHTQPSTGDIELMRLRDDINQIIDQVTNYTNQQGWNMPAYGTDEFWHTIYVSANIHDQAELVLSDLKEELRRVAREVLREKKSLLTRDIDDEGRRNDEGLENALTLWLWDTVRKTGCEVSLEVHNDSRKILLTHDLGNGRVVVYPARFAFTEPLSQNDQLHSALITEMPVKLTSSGSHLAYYILKEGDPLYVETNASETFAGPSRHCEYLLTSTPKKWCLIHQSTYLDTGWHGGVFGSAVMSDYQWRKFTVADLDRLYLSESNGYHFEAWDQTNTGPTKSYEQESLSGVFGEIGSLIMNTPVLGEGLSALGWVGSKLWWGAVTTVWTVPSWLSWGGLGDRYFVDSMIARYRVLGCDQSAISGDLRDAYYALDQGESPPWLDPIDGGWNADRLRQLEMYYRETLFHQCKGTAGTDELQGYQEALDYVSRNGGTYLAALHTNSDCGQRVFESFSDQQMADNLAEWICTVGGNYGAIYGMRAGSEFQRGAWAWGSLYALLAGSQYAGQFAAEALPTLGLFHVAKLGTLRFVKFSADTGRFARSAYLLAGAYRLFGGVVLFTFGNSILSTSFEDLPRSIEQGDVDGIIRNVAKLSVDAVIVWKAIIELRSLRGPRGDESTELACQQEYLPTEGARPAVEARVLQTSAEGRPTQVGLFVNRHTPCLCDVVQLLKLNGVDVVVFERLPGGEWRLAANTQRALPAPEQTTPSGSELVPVDGGWRMPCPAQPVPGQPPAIPGEAPCQARTSFSALGEAEGRALNSLQQLHGRHLRGENQGLDCDELAEHIDFVVGQGKFLIIIPETRWNDFNLPVMRAAEGNPQCVPYKWHVAWVNWDHVFDPMRSSEPIPLETYQQEIRAVNPDQPIRFGTRQGPLQYDLSGFPEPDSW